MKKVFIGIVAVVILFLGYTGVKSIIDSASVSTETEKPVVTTSAPTVLESLNLQLSDLKTQVTSLKNNDAIMQAKIDQLIQILKSIEAELAKK
jgi:chaperonin cofactor prefoldin